MDGSYDWCRGFLVVCFFCFFARTSLVKRTGDCGSFSVERCGISNFFFSFSLSLLCVPSGGPLRCISLMSYFGSGLLDSVFSLGEAAFMVGYFLCYRSLFGLFGRCLVKKNVSWF